jgi:hypothetical protein
LERQEVALAFDFALASAGRSIPARIAMIAMTTRSSISVKPVRGVGLLRVWSVVFMTKDGR